MLGLVLPIAAVTGFLWHGERVAAEAMDLPFLEACDGRWEGPNELGEMRCLIPLLNDPNRPKFGEASGGIYTYTPDEDLKRDSTIQLEAKGWKEQVSLYGQTRCYKYPGTAGHLNLETFMEVSAPQDADSLLQTRGYYYYVHVAVHRPEPLLRERLRSALIAVKHRVKGRPSSEKWFWCD